MPPPGAASGGEGGAGLARAVERAAAEGVARLAIVAWRDLEDPEAGGSELHAHEVARRLAAAGMEVLLRTSSVPGGAEEVAREGYAAVRRSGRYQVFAAAPAELLRGRLGRFDGLVEIWNGMPFFSPLWAPPLGLRRVVLLHHVHADMWPMVLPPLLAATGRTIETRLAPPLYRRTRILTLSGSSREELLARLRLSPSRVSVVPPGVGAAYSPGGRRAERPLVLAVGRLVPVKRFQLLLRAVAEVRRRGVPAECLILGEGRERSSLEALAGELGLSPWVSMPGHVTSEELVAAYRRAWVLGSSSAHEGWDMTVSEAAACGTPAVATRIVGHRDTVADGETGYLVGSVDELATRLVELLSDGELREQMGKAASARVAPLTWELATERILSALVEEATPLARRLRERRGREARTSPSSPQGRSWSASRCSPRRGR